jgi:hypothetical protein
MKFGVTNTTDRHTTYSSASGDTNAEVTEVRSVDDYTELVLEICAGRRLNYD